jgi:hypothetical protein
MSTDPSRRSTQSAQLAQELFEGIRQKGHCPPGTVTYTGQAALDDFPRRSYPSRTAEGTEYSLQLTSQPVAGKLCLLNTRACTCTCSGRVTTSTLM